MERVLAVCKLQQEMGEVFVFEKYGNSRCILKGNFIKCINLFLSSYFRKKVFNFFDILFPLYTRKLNSPHNQHYCPFFFAFRSYGKSEEFPFYVVELYANEDDTRKKIQPF